MFRGGKEMALYSVLYCMHVHNIVTFDLLILNLEFCP